MTPGGFIADELGRWEGKLSRDPNDAGNWSTGQKGVGVLLGSNYGVTGRTLAVYRGCPVAQITPADIAGLTLGVAVDLSLRLFYYGPGLNRLPWSRVAASVLDFCWGTGPVAGIKTLQDILDLSQDGVIGAATVAAFSARLTQWGEGFLAGAFWAMREEYYERLVERRPSDAVYLHGWDNRSGYFTPSHPEGWWVRFAS